MRLGIAFLLGPALGLALAGCDREKAPAPQGEAPAAANAAHGYPTGRLDRSYSGTAAPDVAFEDPHGRIVRLADFRGRPLLVNLWATWCAPCIVEMPSLDRLAVREGEAMEILALSQDVAGRAPVERFFAGRDFARLEPYLDADMGVMTALGLDTLPTTILYDADGREVWRMVGMADWESERAARLLTEAEGG